MTALARARNLRAVTNTPRRGVLYLRQSQAKEETISDTIQRGAGLQYAAQNNIVIVGEIWEQLSGRIWHRRPGVIKAMGMVENGDAEVIILWRWNRLSRRRLHWAIAEDKVAGIGGEIVSATEGPVETAAGRLNRNVLVDFAEFESDSIGEVWADAHELRRARGLPAVGGRRYGYRWIREQGVPECYKIDEGEADAVVYMHERWMDGWGGTPIARELNNRGYRTSRDNLWTGRTINSYLDSGFAYGLLARVPNNADGPIAMPFSQREWRQGAHPPILDGRWEEYHALRLDRSTQTVAPRVRNPAHPFAGLLKCGECESRPTMQRASRGARQPGYEFRCAQVRIAGTARMVSIAERRLTTIVLGWLQDVADEVDEAAGEQAAQINRRSLKITTDRDLAAREIASIDRQLVALTRELLDEKTPLPRVVFEATQAELMTERAGFEAQLRVAEQAAVEMIVDPVTTAKGLLAEWNTLSNRGRRDILATLIRRIYVRRGEKFKAPARVEIVAVWAD